MKNPIRSLLLGSIPHIVKEVISRRKQMNTVEFAFILVM